jgi:hypothetical protein
MAASYTVRWSNNSGFGSGTVLGSQSFAATGGSNAPWIVSGITNCTPSCYFEVQGVAGSSTSPWSTATTAVTIAAPYSGNAVSGKVTFTAPTGGIKGPLYVGFYDMTTGNVYATVVGSKAAPPTSPASYSLYVPTGTNYFFFGMVDQNNTGLLNVPGSISNTNNQSNATTTIDPSQPSTLTQNLTLATNVAGTGPQNAYAVVRTSHNQNNYANDNYQIDLRVNGAYKLPVSVELTSGANVLVPVDIATGAFNGNNDEFDFWPNLNGATPNVGDAYSFLVTYSDGTQETLNITISAVLNAFATLNSPAANVTGVSLTPNFSWTDPANASNYYYQFQLQDSNNNTIWKIPGNHSNSNGFSSSTTSLTWGNDPTGNNATPTVTSLSSLSTYQWSIQVSDANGDEATEQVTFETMESTLSLPSNSIPGSALVNNAYSQSLNASGGSGVDTFTVNGSTGTTNNNVTTWTLTDGLIASTTVGSNQLTVSGTPTTAPATVTLDVAVADNQGHSVSAVQYTIDVVNGPNGANNKYLSGTYVCKFDGFNDSDGSRWTSLSNVKANGAAGTMTSGIWDMNGRDFSSEMSGTATGTYSIGPDNNGLLTMNSTVTSGGSGTHTGQYAIALNNTGSSITATEFRMVEIDDVGSSPSGMTGTGHCYQANTSVFATDPYKGNSFVFMMNGENGSGTPQATLGRFVAGSTTGSITGGIVDQAKVSDSSVTTITFTGGSYTTPDSTNGRSTLTFNTSGGAVSFQVYDIDANRMFMIQTTDAKAQSADVRKQQQATYSGTNLNGPFVLYTQTYEYSNGSISGYASEVMQGTGNGASGLTLNQNYTDEDGTYKVGNDTGSGTLTFDSSNPGRASLSTSYLYFFDNNTAFFLSGGASGGNGSGTILETGWTEPQTGSFTNAAIAGDYLLGQLPLMEPESNGNVGEVGLLNATSSNTTGNITTAGMGDFTYDQSQSIGDYAWDTTAPGTGTFLVGSGNKGASCAAISTTAGSRKSVCIINADSEPGVMIFQQ